MNLQPGAQCTGLEVAVIINPIRYRARNGGGLKPAATDYLRTRNRNVTSCSVFGSGMARAPTA